MELMLSLAQGNAIEAKWVGWINAAYTIADTLTDYVDTMTTGIVRFREDATKATEKSIAHQKPTQEMFEADQATFVTLACEPAVQYKQRWISFWTCLTIRLCVGAEKKGQYRWLRGLI